MQFFEIIPYYPIPLSFETIPPQAAHSKTIRIEEAYRLQEPNTKTAEEEEETNLHLQKNIICQISSSPC
jgi:hypothetical protein